MTYQPQSSPQTGLTNWTNVNGPITTNHDGFLSVEGTISTADKFYRILTLLP